MTRKLSEIKDKQDKQWEIESAARTLQEMGRIKADRDLMTAAEKELDKMVSEADAAKAMLTSMNARTPAMRPAG